jgi:hypothetical protein
MVGHGGLGSSSFVEPDSRTGVSAFDRHEKNAFALVRKVSNGFFTVTELERTD